MFSHLHNRWMRLGILILLMAMILGSTVDSSWTQSVFNYTPLPWMYRFDYLKYLFIVIPGSIAGEYLAEWMKAFQKETDDYATSPYRKISIMLMILSVIIIIGNLYGLYTRYLVVNLVVTVLMPSWKGSKHKPRRSKYAPALNNFFHNRAIPGWH